MTHGPGRGSLSQSLLNYNTLLSSRTSDKWKRIGISRRSGVAVPLFSIYSKNSIGAGEIPDLRILIDWCKQNGMSILQLLPLNELGFDFAPYNAISTFAIEPMYLSIKKLRKVDLKPFRKEIRKLKKNFPKGKGKVNYEIKNEKLNLLRDIFETADPDRIDNYKMFISKNIHWLRYYSLFKILTKINNNKSWQEWELKYKYISAFTTEKILQKYSGEISFNYWLQWQLYEQLLSVKKYAKRNGVFIMGDLPFLVSRNSADVWAYKNYFKLNLSSGAPPDMYFAKGQRWGMPPYNWENIASDNFGYIKERLRYAENFFDMFRIDHFVGLFRVWTVDLKTPEEFGGMYGKFDPEEEYSWEEHGKNILQVITDSTTMMACAEDLGTVPKCSEKVLKEFGVTGINVQRWEKNHNDNFNFLPADKYRINSVATVSTHDSSTLPAWWEYEAGTIDEFSFRQICEKQNIKGERYADAVKNLFEENYPRKDRILWKIGISNVYVLLEYLKLNFDQGKEIIDVYLSSFGEKNKFWKYFGLHEDLEQKASVKFIKNSLKKINSTSSIFSIQLLMEYLYLDQNILKNFGQWDYRINFPGTVDQNNWSMILPVSLEKLMELDINNDIKEIVNDSSRI